MNKERKYFTRLDYIRIISCIMVLLYHLNIVQGGFLVVCTFFTLSGYLGCISALKNKNFSIRKYYINRIKKLYIPLLVLISITVIVTKYITDINWLNLKPECISAICGYNNFWQLNANLDYFTKNVHSPLIHSWYISILMQFDLIFPITFFIFKKIDKNVNNNISTVIVFLLGIASTFVFFNMSKTKDVMMVYYNTIARSFSIIWGVFLALIHHKYKLAKTIKKFNEIIFISYIAILIALCIFISNEIKNYAFYMILATIISCRLIEYSIIKESKKNTANFIINFFARCSYEIYLVQYPIIFFMQNTEFSGNIKIPIIIGLTIIISCILHLLLNLSLKSKIYKIIRIIIICSIIAFGSWVIINEKDHTAEMAELENKLNENLKIIEQKNKEYVNTVANEEKEWNTLLENLEIEESKAVAEKLKSLPIVGVGDSVFLDAVNELYQKFPKGYFDGKISRSIIGGKEVLIDLKNKGKLSNIVVLALSTNGDYSDKRNRELMEILENREIYWINAVGADDPKFNENFKNFAKNYSNIHIVNWEAAAKGHPEYFYADGIHAKGNGIKVYVDTIYDTIYNDYLKIYKSKKRDFIQKKANEFKKKITFYGNDVLTNSFNYIQQKIGNTSFNVRPIYEFNSLYNELENKIKNNTLEYKVVFLYDKQANISDEQYLKIVNLCKGHDIYICNITGRNFAFLNSKIRIINFYNEIQTHEDYMMADKIHLSEKGNIALANILLDSITN